MPDGVFVDDDDRLAFTLHPVPTSADVLAILDRIVRRIARRLADEACDDRWEDIDVLAQVQVEAAATWRSPHNGKPTVRACAGPAAGRTPVRRRFVARTTADALGRGRVCADVGPMWAR